VAGEELFPDVPERASVSAELKELAGRDQTRSERDQTGADFDQTISDLDQSASDRDQRASDRDQEAADRDQVDADRSHRNGHVGSGWPDTRRTRSQTAIERDVSSHARRESARARDAVAERRDGDADARDADARTRDASLAAMDAELAQLERSDAAAAQNGALGLLKHALADRRRAAAARERSAPAREAAACDRAAARANRVRAAADRRAAQAALVSEGIDHLTGALRRNGGLDGLRRELERTRRTNESLTVAFIDVDHLKQVNDEHGHIAGDALLRAVVASVRQVLRPYDLIMRFGGDEFVCVLCGQTPASLQQRFAQVAAELARRHAGASITVGFAQGVADETPEQLVARADQAMIAVRRQRDSLR
jgi:diguanylate cyclase (GGDEF)-like protein